MNNYILKYSLFAFLLGLIQVLVLNNVLLFGYINPLIYVLFIFIFPLSNNKYSVLIISFFLGLLIDFFSNSGGSNAAALVFIAYIRLPVLHIIQNNIEFDYLLFNIKKLNMIQIIIYILTLVFIHHFILFFLEYYTLKSFGHILLKAFYTSLFSSIVIGLAISLFVKDINE